MGRRIVVVEFDDENNASDFVKYIEDDNKVRTIGVYYYPSPRVYCRCNRKPDLRNFRNHLKFGLKVCTVCGRPSVHWRNGIIARLEVALGKAIS